MELVREQRNEIKVYHETDPYLVIPNFYLKNKDYDNYYAFMNDILYIYQKLFNLKLFLNRYIIDEISSDGENCITYLNAELIEQNISKFKSEMLKTFNKYYENTVSLSHINQRLLIINLKIASYEIHYFLENSVNEWEYRKNIAQKLVQNNVSFRVDNITDNLKDYDFQKSIGIGKEQKLVENTNEKKNYFWNFLVFLIGFIFRFRK